MKKPDNGSMKSEIKCAIIGLGRIASSLEDDKYREKPATHTGAIHANTRTVLVGGFDIDPEAGKTFAQRWNLNQESDLCSSSTELIKTKKPDILHIATHEDSHLDYLAQAVALSVPVVILEKPVSDSLRKAVKAGKNLGNTRVIVNHERRYSRDYQMVKEHIRKETYGPLESVSGKLYMGMKRPVRSILIHDGTHMMDIISFLTGEPLKKLKIHRVGTGDHTVYASARCSGTAVMCEFGNSRDHLVFELELSFTKGRIRIGNGIYEEYESRESTFYEKMRSLYPADYSGPVKTGYFERMLEDAVKVFDDPATRPLSSYQDGLESLKLIEQIRKKLPRS